MTQDTILPYPFSPVTIPSLLEQAARKYGNAVFLEDGPLRLTFEETRERAETVARALIAWGVERGDRVAIWAPNCWEWPVVALGIHLAGAALVPLNTRFKGLEAAFILNRSQAKILFTFKEFLGHSYAGLLRDCGDVVPSLEHIVHLQGGSGNGALALEEFLLPYGKTSVETLRARQQEVTEEDLSDIIFTSGTTGRPKGVLCTHRQSLQVFWVWSEVTGLREGDRYLIVNPFFHTFGYKAGWLAALMRGATVLPHQVFDPRAVLERIGRDKVSVLPGPPALYQAILAQPDRASFDLSTLRLAVTGAAIIPVELIRRMRADLGIETVLTAYGLTETTGTVTMCRRGDPAELIASTSGRAIPGVEVQVWDGEDRPLPPGEPGEIMVRGFNVTAGYYQDREATADSITPEGWLHTGDIGTLDPEGNIRITDRKKDLLIAGGFNVYPAEVEQILLRHPAIAQVAVVGVPDERLGEVGWAYTVLKPGLAVTGEELYAWSRENMANFKVPRKFVFLEALPMNASGKVLKYQLRESAVSTPAH